MNKPKEYYLVTWDDSYTGLTERVNDDDLHVIEYSEVQRLKDVISDLVTVCERQMRSDDACGHPFNEDMDDVLNLVKKELE
jgi:hypothetical protein